MAFIFYLHGMEQVPVVTSKQHSARVYLVPVPIAEGAINTLSAEVISVTATLTHYFAEDARTARRALRLMHPQLNLEPIQIETIDKHAGPDTKLFRDWLKAGHNVGIMSESGCPGIADPGSVLVAEAHKAGIQVVPLTGPNSIILALMASGLNGQSFCFRGYLPVKEPLRSKAIHESETLSATKHQTQIFIETPYRNDHLLADLLKTCNGKTQLCIARNIGGSDSLIITRSIHDWKREIPVLGKMPTVFLLLA